MKDYLKKSFVVFLSLLMIVTMLPMNSLQVFAEDVETDPAVVDVQEGEGDAAGDALTEPVNDVTAGDAEDPGTDPAEPGDAGESAQADDPEAEAESEELAPAAEIVENDGTVAVTVHGDAAESREKAIEELMRLGLDEKQAKEYVDKLFKPAEKAEDEPKAGGEYAPSGPIGDLPTSVGGNAILYVEAWWTTPDTVDNGIDELLYCKPSDDSKQRIQIEIDYGLSGAYNYGAGDIVIKFPAYLFHHRDTGEPYGAMIIPYAQDPDTHGDYSWKREGDYYIMTNNKPLSAATKAFVQFDVVNLYPHDLVDMQLSDLFHAELYVKVHDDTMAMRSNDIQAQFDTDAKVTKVTKKAYGEPVVVGADSIPEEQRIPGEDKYVLVTWYITVLTKANTWYTLSYKDTIPEIETNSRGDTYSGFIIGSKAPDGFTLDKNNVYHGYTTDRLLTYSVTTAYPASQFEEEVDYTFHNHIEFTLVEDDDPDNTSTKYADAEITWNYADPEHLNPPGHYMVYKNGNDDKEGNNLTHKLSYSKYPTTDVHMWYRDYEGWYGTYGSALNRLLAQYDEHGEEGFVRASYTIDSVGYVMPWTFDDESYKADGAQAPWNIGNYTRPVTIYTKDWGFSFGRQGAKLTPITDYKYISIEFPDIPWVYKGRPNRINADGSWYAQTADDGTFLYTRDYDRANWPEIELQIYRNGQWEHWATASWNSGDFVATLADGTTQTEKVVEVPDDIETFRTKVVMQNANGTGDSMTTQAAIDYDVRVVIGLKSTESLVNRINGLFEQSNSPKLYLYNRANLVATYGDAIREGDEEPIVTIGTENYSSNMLNNKDGYDILSGYSVDTMTYPSKKADFDEERDYDTTLDRVTIHYEAKVEERSLINSRQTWQEAIDEGNLVADYHGVWRDLLPKGVVPDASTVRVRAKDAVIDTRVIEDYNGSERYLLEVEVSLVPTPEKYTVGDVEYYEDAPWIAFDAYVDIASVDVGFFDKPLHNVISFQSDNDTLGTIEGYRGEPDDPHQNNNVATKGAFETEEERDAMTDLDPATDTNSFVYAGANVTIGVPSKGITGLNKQVMTNFDGSWTDGIYWKNPEEYPAGNARNVYNNGYYSYKLTYMPEAQDTYAKNIKFYDSLENFYPDRDNDPIDDGAPRWRGTFLGVDTRDIEALGCAPKVYYSTVAYLDVEEGFDEDTHSLGNMDLTSSVWTRAEDFTEDLSTVKAVAIDCSQDKDGNDFIVEAGNSVHVIINMKAPAIDEDGFIQDEYGCHLLKEDPHAYNAASALATSVDATTHDEDPYHYIWKEYTKVGLKEFSVDVEKVWDDDDDRDGLRPDTVTLRLLADGKDIGRTVTLPIMPPSSPWIIPMPQWYYTFEHLDYTNPDGSVIHYTLVEDEVPPGYTASVVIDGNKFTMVNKHITEKVSKEGSKIWSGDTEYTRPEYVTVRLYADGVMVQQKKIYPDLSGRWYYSFTNLPKYEDGHEIVYTVEEVRSGAIDSYHPEYDGDDIINTYHPYGDLEVKKIVDNVTPQSRDTEFTFGFEFSKDDDPLYESFAYAILDEDGNVIPGREGTVATGQTVTIKGGESIHVYDIPEYVDYKVYENEEDGFTLVAHSGDTGTIKPNATKYAEFKNRYDTQGFVDFEGVKTLYGRELLRYKFHFGVYRLGVNEEGEETATLIRTASNEFPDNNVTDEDGNIIFSTAPVHLGYIYYGIDDNEKTYRYKIVEFIGRGEADWDRAVNADGVTYADATDEQRAAGGFTLDGYTFDNTCYYATVTVTDNGDGTMKTEVVYTDENGNVLNEEDLLNYEMLFENYYDAEGKLDIRAWKNLQGRKLTEGEFEFMLLDEEGKPLGIDENGKTFVITDPATQTPAIAAVGENGLASFPTIKYDQDDIGKTYYYAVKEIIPEEADRDPAVEYDTKVYGYRVVITDNGDGTLGVDEDLATPLGADGKQAEQDEDGNVSIADWTVEEAKLPTFVNTLKPGSLSVTKYIDNPEEADLDQMFHFFVRLIGPDIEDGEMEYEITRVADYSNAAGGNTGGGDPVTPADPGQDGDDEDDEDAIDASEADFEEAGAENDEEEEGAADAEQAPSAGFFRNVLDLFAEDVYGAEDDIAGGTYEGVDWRITADGELIIGADGATQTFSANEGRVQTSWPWHEYREQITSARFVGTVIGQGKLTSMFYGNKNMSTVDLSGLDTTAVTSLSSMFRECAALSSVDVSGFSTSNVTSIAYMFQGCGALTSIDLSNFDTAKVTGMNSLFQGCVKLTSADISSFNTSKVTTMASMFQGCGIPTLDLRHFDVSKVTNMSSMFGNGTIKSIDTTGWNTASLTNMANMFVYARSLTDIKGEENWNTSNVTSMYFTFCGCSNLEELDVSGWRTPKLTNMSRTFYGLSKITTLDANSWDVSNVTDMVLLFSDCTSLTSINVSSWRTSNVKDMTGTFQKLTSLTELDLSNWDTSSCGGFQTFLTMSNNIRRLTLGPDVKLDGKGGIANYLKLRPPVPQTDRHQWIREDEMYGPWTVDEFVTNYDPATMNGTWIWYDPQTYTIEFTADEDVSGSMAPVNPAYAEDYTLPSCKFFKNGFIFDHWDVVNVDTRAENTYADRATIPAKTYLGATTVTLKAVFVERETTVNVVDGQFDFWLYGGEKATFSDIPAGTSYEVWEETPDGWVLVEVVNASGVIEPLTESKAEFTNRYQPGVASAQFHGTKLLDHTAATRGAFTFVLYENGEEIERVTTLDGGFIQFTAINYTEDDIGTHTYTIAEVDPNLDTIDFDTHTETVTVVVKKDGDGNLTAKETYDEDGIRFVNKTRPGVLKITKEVDILTPENYDDEFTFRITFHNEAGQPLGEDDEIYWYSEGAPKPFFGKDGGTSDKKGASLADAWNTVKGWASSAWNGFRSLFVEDVYGAEDERSTEGNAYAVLTDEGELIFFRSNETYENEATGTFTDILGNSYAGKVYADLETDTIYTTDNDSTTVDERTLNCKWYADRTKISSIRVADGQKICPKTLIYWFSGLTYRDVTVDLNGLDTSAVTSAYSMFRNSTGIVALDVSMLDTSKVVTMTHMFSGMSRMTSINVQGLDTSSATAMNYMFNGDRALTELDLRGFDTSKVTVMSYMFQSCSNVRMLDISTFDTSKLQTAWEMFEYMGNLVDFRYNPETFVTDSATTISAMFQGCSKLKSLDLSHWNTSKVRNIHYLFSGCTSLEEIKMSDDFVVDNVARVYGLMGMFYGCHSLKELDIDHWNTSNINTFSGMFAYCRSLKTLNIPNFDTRAVLNTYYNSGTTGNRFGSLANMFRGCTNLETLNLGENFYFLADDSDRSHRISVAGMFQDCSSLKELDIHNMDTHCVLSMNDMFKGTTSLEKIKLGDTFMFKDNAVLENAPSTAPYIGKWAKEDYSMMYTAADLKTNYNENQEAHAGTWIWAIDQTRGWVHFDANGGYTSAPDVSSEDPNISVTMPDSSTTTYPHHELVGWSTDPEGSRALYQPGQSYEGLITLGSVLTLYAQWADSPNRDYTIKYYQQRQDLNGYNLAGSEKATGVYGQEITVTPTRTYTGFVTPPAQVVTIAEDDSTVVEFYYDRVTYNVVFDGNGATSGVMLPQQFVYGISQRLNDNSYSRVGYLFTGWNTKPDGSGRPYTNMQSVSNLTTDGSDFVLYAQWIDNPNDVLTPTNGQVIVTCRPGETIVIPDLPAGTTYIIEEINNPDGWTMTGIIGEEGTIEANTVSYATVSNAYEAEGSITLRAKKTLVGREPKDSDVFTFDLYDRNPWKQSINEPPAQPIDTKTTGTMNSDGTFTVEFSDLSFTADDIGTHTFWILERKGDDPYISYDGHLETVTVTVTDLGGGILDVTAKYSSQGNQIAEFGEFYNYFDPGFGALFIQKDVTEDSIEAAEDVEFTFRIDITPPDGMEPQEDFKMSIGYFDPRGRMIFVDGWPISSGDTVSIPAGYFILVDGIYAGSTYEVTEIEDKEGWSLVESLNVTGTIQIKWDMWAYFTNDYSAEGQVVLEGTKELVGKDLTEGEFTFVVMDEDDNRVATGKNDADGNIIFDPIRYDKYDVGQTYSYSVKEIEEDEGGITFDQTVFTVDVTITDNGDGTLTATPVYSAPIAFTNEYYATGTAKVGVTKAISGRDWNDADSFDFEIKAVDNAPMPKKDNVVTVTKDSPDFTEYFGTISYSTHDMKDENGETVKTKTFTYEVNEVIPENSDPNIVYDENVYVVTVTVTDNGDGSMTTEVSWALKGADADAGEAADAASGTGDDPIPFTNIYAEGEARIGVTKSIEGREWKPGDSFDFTIVPVGDAPMPNGPTSATIKYETPEKTAWFGPVQFGLSDMLDENGEIADTKVFTYEVTEVIPKASARDPYMRYDENVYVATVTVTYAGNGVLETEVSWSCKTKGVDVKTGKNGTIIIKNPYREIKTGDTTVMLPYIGMFVAAGLMLAVIVLRRRARR